MSRPYAARSSVASAVSAAGGRAGYAHSFANLAAVMPVQVAQREPGTVPGAGGMAYSRRARVTCVSPLAVVESGSNVPESEDITLRPARR